MPIRASEHSRLHLIDVEEIASSTPLPSDLYEALYDRLAALIAQRGYSCVFSAISNLAMANSHSPPPFRLPQDATKPRKALRLAFSSFGSPSWGTTSSAVSHSFIPFHSIPCPSLSPNSSRSPPFPVTLQIPPPSPFPPPPIVRLRPPDLPRAPLPSHGPLPPQ